MATNSDDTRWVDDKVDALEMPPGPQSVEKARVRLDVRKAAAIRHRRLAWAASAILLGLLALPGTRAAAQRLWNQLTLGRVEIIHGEAEVPEEVAAVFAMDTEPFEEQQVGTLEEAARLVGFQPMLPRLDGIGAPSAVLVTRAVTLSTGKLQRAEIQSALARVGVTDLSVPVEWEGMTLSATGGPALTIEYPGFYFIQTPPLNMTAPAAFELGRFMEMAFRVFGRPASEAHALGEKFAANPALVMHFPRSSPVRDVALKSGKGIYVGDTNRPDDICFFWNNRGRAVSRCLRCPAMVEATA